MSDDLPFTDEPLPEPDVEMIEAVYGGSGDWTEEAGLPLAISQVVDARPRYDCPRCREPLKRDIANAKWSSADVG